MNILQCKNLTKKYGDFYALTNVNLSVPNGGGIVGCLVLTAVEKPPLSSC